MDFYPISDAAHLVQQFDACTLPEEEWTHEAHLMVALAYISRFGLSESYPRMREALLRYNSTIGREGTFHATMTYFWLRAVHDTFVSEDGMVEFDQNNIEELLFNEELNDRNLWLRWYPKEVMMSADAREEVIPLA